jgi:hypothetical protein
MKVTVYRPRESVGLGAPRGFLGEDHPTEGDWVQSAKSDQPDGMDAHIRLHMMARDFLIRSMYHVREPRFIGYAIENYAAACEVMGHSLPLREDLATWPHYERSEVEVGTPDDYRWMLANIAKVFGDAAAQKQAETLDLKWIGRANGPPNSGRGR